MSRIRIKDIAQKVAEKAYQKARQRAYKHTHYDGNEYIRDYDEYLKEVGGSRRR